MDSDYLIMNVGVERGSKVGEQERFSGGRRGSEEGGDVHRYMDREHAKGVDRCGCVDESRVDSGVF